MAKTFHTNLFFYCVTLNYSESQLQGFIYRPWDSSSPIQTLSIRIIIISEERKLESNLKLKKDPEKKTARPNISQLNQCISQLIMSISRLYMSIS